MSGFPLSKLLSALLPDRELPNVLISGLCLEGRRAQPGDLFVACVGETQGREARMDSAITQGAVAIVTTAENSVPFIGYRKLPHYPPVPVCSVPRLPEQFGTIAAAFYQHPSRHMKIIGCTGTNGKTSSTHCLAQALTLLGQPCGLIGGLGYGPVENLKDPGLTTPDPLTLQQQLCDLQQRGMQAVALEVSSHALVQGRVAGIGFEVGMMTNISQDHLDYHGNMEAYAQAKRLLFEHYGVRKAIFNLNDAYAFEVAKSLSGSLPVHGYGLYESLVGAPLSLSGWVCGYDFKGSLQGFSLSVDSTWGSGTLEAPFLGRFNAQNLLGVLTALCVMGVDFQQALSCFPRLRKVPGRMQTFGGGQYQPLVVVDYAHTPDALEEALAALYIHKKHRLFCVFGCGGDRDQGKRHLMGKIAERYSDVIIVTSDNPRSEEAQKIVEDILAGLLCPWAVEVELDRKTAIAHALRQAHPGDIVLVAGKGHESYQHIGDERFYFSDIEQVQVLLSL